MIINLRDCAYIEASREQIIPFFNMLITEDILAKLFLIRGNKSHYYVHLILSQIISLIKFDRYNLIYNLI